MPDWPDWELAEDAGLTSLILVSGMDFNIQRKSSGPSRSLKTGTGGSSFGNLNVLTASSGTCVEPEEPVGTRTKSRGFCRGLGLGEGVGMPDPGPDPVPKFSFIILEILLFRGVVGHCIDIGGGLSSVARESESGPSQSLIV